MLTSTRLEQAPILRGRNLGIDILRAFFSIWVLVAHVIPWAIARGQDDPILLSLQSFLQALIVIFQGTGALHPAVLGFIVLSGYCIHRGGLREQTDPILPYAIKRVFRILPVFVLAAFVGYVLIMNQGEGTYIYNMTGQVEADPAALALKISGLSVFHPLNFPQIFQGNAPLNTVMVEMWLYIFYVPLLMVARRVPLWAFYSGLAAMLAVGMAFNSPAWFQNASLYKYLIYWWIGAAFVGRAENKLHIKTILLLLGVYAASRFAGLTHPVFIEVFHIGLALFFAWLIRGSEDVTLSGFLAQFFAYLGRAGYSLYAFHAPLAIFMLWQGVNWGLVLALTIVISLLLFKLIEDPTSRLGYKLAKKHSKTIRSEA